MSMRLSISKCLFRLGVSALLLLGWHGVVKGENKAEESASMRYEKKVERYKRGWARLIPQYEKLQYAGSMGLISVGFGWDYGRKEQWETDVFLGYLPRFSGNKGHVTLTLKENYIPWKLDIKKGEWMVGILRPAFISIRFSGMSFGGANRTSTRTVITTWLRICVLTWLSASG